MLEFVTSKVHSIYSDFGELLNDSFQLLPQWTELSLLLETREDELIWIPVAVSHTLEVATDHFRRLVSMARSYPWLLAYLVATPPDFVDHEARGKCAAELLSLSDDVIADDMAIKFRNLFFDELTEAANTGTLEIDLWDLVISIMDMWPTDTQVVEGCNNIIRTICRLSPNISWKLLSARIVSKKRLAGKDPQLRMDIVRRCGELHAARKKDIEAFVRDSSRYIVDVPAASGPTTKPPKPIVRYTRRLAVKQQLRFKRGLHGHSVKFAPTAELVVSVAVEGSASSRKKKAKAGLHKTVRRMVSSV